MSTGEYCNLITELGGDVSSLPDLTEKTLANEIIRLVAHKCATATEVASAIGSMTEEQVASVKTKLGITE